MEIYSDRKENLTAKTFYKTRKDATQRVMDIEKSLLPTSETYSGAILLDAKIPQMFESINNERDNQGCEIIDSYKVVNYTEVWASIIFIRRLLIS